jgi:hypothetical protein
MKEKQMWRYFDEQEEVRFFAEWNRYERDPKNYQPNPIPRSTNYIRR